MKNLIIALGLSVACTSLFAQENQITKVDKKRELASYSIIASPNPSTDRVHVNAPEGSICKVVSAQGTYVGTWEVRESGLELTDLGTGTYFVQILLSGETVTRRFVIL